MTRIELLRLARKEWGCGWDRLSVREQRLVLCELFTKCFLSQLTINGEVVKDLQGLAKEVLQWE